MAGLDEHLKQQWSSVDNLLHVVDNEQASMAHDASKHVMKLELAASTQVRRKLVSNRGLQGFAASDRGEVDKPDTVGKVVGKQFRAVGGKARLADATRTDERQQTRRRGEQVANIRYLSLTTDERGQVRGKGAKADGIEAKARAGRWFAWRECKAERCSLNFVKLQRIRESPNRIGIRLAAFATLKRPNGIGGQAGALGKRFLGQAGSPAKCSQALTERL